MTGFLDAAARGNAGSYLAGPLAEYGQSVMQRMPQNALMGAWAPFAIAGHDIGHLAAGAAGGLARSINHLMTTPYDTAADPALNADYIRRAFDAAGGLSFGGGLATRPASSIGMAGRPRRYKLDYYGSPVEILENPSRQALERFLSGTKYKAARRIKTADGDVYVWDAGDPALHEVMRDRLGLPKQNTKFDTIEID